jgi:hypothetical protein
MARAPRLREAAMTHFMVRSYAAAHPTPMCLARHSSSVISQQGRASSFFRRALHLLARPLSLGLGSGLVRSRLARCALRVRVPPNEGSGSWLMESAGFARFPCHPPLRCRPSRSATVILPASSSRETAWGKQMREAEDRWRREKIAENERNLAAKEEEHRVRTIRDYDRRLRELHTPNTVGPRTNRSPPLQSPSLMWKRIGQVK